MSHAPISLADAILNELKHSGLNVPQFAKKAGISRSYMRKLVNGKAHNPRLSTMFKLSKAGMQFRVCAESCVDEQHRKLVGTYDRQPAAPTPEKERGKP